MTFFTPGMTYWVLIALLDYWTITPITLLHLLTNYTYCPITPITLLHLLLHYLYCPIAHIVLLHLLPLSTIRHIALLPYYTY